MPTPSPRCWVTACFLARLNSGNGAPISLNNAKQYIPTNFELIRELVDFLDELDREEYREIKWLIEEILSIHEYP